MKALNVFKLNVFNILYFMYKCKQNLNPLIFSNIFTHRAKTKYALRNENSIQEPLCRTNFSQYCISYRELNLWNKILISKKLTFTNSDSLQAFKRELNRFLLSVELNDLEILKELLSPSKSNFAHKKYSSLLDRSHNLKLRTWISLWNLLIRLERTTFGFWWSGP